MRWFLRFVASGGGVVVISCLLHAAVLPTDWFVAFPATSFVAAHLLFITVVVLPALSFTALPTPYSMFRLWLPLVS